MPPKEAAPAASASASGDVAPSVPMPYTVVCKHCQASLVDSADVDRTISELRLVVLLHEESAGLTVAAKSRKIRKSSKEESSFHDVNCDACKHTVGRKYTLIAQHPDMQNKLALLQEETDVRPRSEPITDTSDDQTRPASGTLPSELGGTHPEPANMAEEFTNIKRFCLMLHDGQESLSAQVKQLARQPAKRSLPVQQPEPHNCSCGKDLEELKTRLARLEASLQTVVEDKNRLMAQMKLQSKRSFADFAVEIPVIRKRVDDSPALSQELTQQQQHLSPPASELSGEKGDDDGNGSRNVERTSRGKVATEEQPQPREADFQGQTGVEMEPIVIDDGYDSDEDGEYQEGAKTPARRAAKRARLAGKTPRGPKRGKGRPSLGSTTDGANESISVVTIATPKAQLDSTDKDVSSMSTGRVTRSRK
ncbi:hypothetical protein Dda_7572 [Drechslerella dactyloides]|uniref:Yippee/Mis18/Cereblon domain-containing protein n=1 Tax=Drechslerella dactyloides TaxID=74499 RepID=A0AAD6NIF1_DREDA|nr:hypothetical protein Dda_7572 [Drechslerella dactyloides]